MKILINVALIGVLMFYSCSPSNGKGKESPKPLQVPIVSENQGSTAGGTKLLTKDVFLKTVWDYNNSPQEWKFKGQKPAIIDFYADWCGPCKIASPILEEISKEYAGKIDIYKIDTEKEHELAAVFRISSIPAFLYIPADGKPVMMAGIGRSKEETKAMFIENINKYLLKR
jgi:thioredoxin